MSIFNRKKKVEYFLEKSRNILSVFTKTQEDCKNLNIMINEAILVKEETIKLLQSDVTVLGNVVTKNNNLVNKIDQFLSN